jgi:glycosyltransferase involved in cell wall biosynthesis
VARALFEAYRRRGHRSWLAVGHRTTADPDVIYLDNERARRGVAGVAARVDAVLGLEDFRYPAARRLLELAPELPDVVHAHNLHGGYFDLRELAPLTRQAPVLLTLHDAWMLTGHCSHSFDCDRWRIGCGSCPDLTIYPAVRRDATALNWRRKRRIYGASRLRVATPCRWLLGLAEASMLAPAIDEGRVVPNGVDVERFTPGDRAAARRSLELGERDYVLSFVANGGPSNPYRDFPSLRDAAAAVAERVDRPVVVLTIGSDLPPEHSGRAELRFTRVDDPDLLAAVYRASDLYVHATRADTFPTTVLEALACGTPVVASAVGGIPEQVRTDIRGGEATGLLVPPGDPAALADGLLTLLSDEGLRTACAANAAADARRRFSLDRQVDAYLEWYATFTTERDVRAA